MKIKTADLIGPALAWAVATIEGYVGLRRNPHAFNQALIMNRADGQCVLFSTLNYPADWSQGGPIIERESIKVGVIDDDKPVIWAAQLSDPWSKRTSVYSYTGPTPLIAAMRCYCCAKLGEYVDIPEELCQRANS